MKKAYEKPTDLQMIRDKEIEYNVMQRQIAEQQAQIEELKKGLSFNMSQQKPKQNTQQHNVQQHNVQQHSAQKNNQPMLKQLSIPPELQNLLQPEHSNNMKSTNNNNNNNNNNRSNSNSNKQYVNLNDRNKNINTNSNANANANSNSNMSMTDEEVMLRREMIKNKLLEEELMKMRYEMLQMQKRNDFTLKMSELRKMEELQKNIKDDSYRQVVRQGDDGVNRTKYTTKPQNNKSNVSNFNEQNTMSDHTDEKSRISNASQMQNPNVMEIFQKKQTKKRKGGNNIVEQILGKEKAQLMKMQEIDQNDKSSDYSTHEKHSSHDAYDKIDITNKNIMYSDNENIVSLDTVDQDEITHISLGSKRSNKSAKSALKNDSKKKTK